MENKNQIKFKKKRKKEKQVLPGYEPGNFYTPDCFVTTTPHKMLHDVIGGYQEIYSTMGHLILQLTKTNRGSSASRATRL